MRGQVLGMTFCDLGKKLCLHVNPSVQDAAKAELPISHVLSFLPIYIVHTRQGQASALLSSTIRHPCAQKHFRQYYNLKNHFDYAKYYTVQSTYY